MNLLDLIIVALGLSAALGGYRLGLLARAFSWIGLALGFYVAASFVPSAVRSLSGSSPTTRLVVAAVVLVGGALLGQAVGMFVGSRVRAVIPWGPLRYLDRSAGAVVGVIGVLVAVWLLIPSMAEVPGSLSREARGSVIGRWVTQAAPSSPNTLQALRRLVGANNFPQVFDVLRPSPAVGPPPAATGLSQALATQLAASTVKVQGVACDRIQEGSGFAVAPNLVVTNAHVVAGEAKTLVDELNGRQLPAEVVAFDSNRDLALLHVSGLGENPLPLTTGHVGQQGAVLGHPNGQDRLDEAPALIRDEVQAVGRDLYGHHSTRRDVFILASQLYPGDSGGALVNDQGQVMGVAFAIAPDQPGTSYALATSELRAVLVAQGTLPTSTGPCLGS